ncbi:MobC family plasmid mobilization relaxosome protein [Vibrio alginolyticus]|uniref:MobC family plasmid mobilization relaxosome protein n=1 Tax=Vibrio alginolyticus TaxID=663 RepID=UPI00215CFDB7|nr:MobC family plasmid mobilization relaxosome protein [Vibrio alginolyticus]MCR9998686.1 MobC family plasmid mobilization relaxosome protein [Vibrio alginolyticus]
MEKESASIHVQARLTPSEYAPFKKLIEITGTKKATLFRHVILSNKNNVVYLGRSSEEEAKKRMVFLANKASNNLNQIAKRLNQAYRSEVVREQHYTRMMNELIGLRSAFEKGIDQC